MIKQIGESVSFGVKVSGLDLIDPVISNFGLECIIIDGPDGSTVTSTIATLSPDDVFVVHIHDDVISELETREYIILCRLYHSGLKFSQYVIHEPFILDVRGKQ